MSSVDDRIIAMKFDNKQFEAGAATTIGTMGKLKSSLNVDKANESLKNLKNTGSNFNLGGIGTSVQGASTKFLALATVGITALANITTAAIQTGAQLVKSLTLAPVLDGYKEYETNLNSIQTILANTQSSGAGLKDVQGALNELNTYSDKTIYNFSEMARNIGTFTAAGVDLKTSTEAIKGIANLAALSGSNSEQASTAMYQLSQAISAGKVGLQDWNSVVNAGMGGTVFQRALAQTAEKMGTLKKGAVELSGPMKNVKINGQSFREALTAKPGQTSWLTSGVLTATLSHFTGDLTDAQLAAEGFTKSDILAIQEQARTATQAATQVKTFTALMDTSKEAVGSGWSQTWQYVFGDFNEAKGSFTALSGKMGGIISASSKARNKIFKDWHDNGGRDALFNSVINSIDALQAVLKPIKAAFREIFPAKTGKDLADLTKRFEKFTKSLIIGPETAAKIKSVFAGVFSVFKIGIAVIKVVASIFGKLFGIIGGQGGTVLTILAKVGDYITAFASKIGDAKKTVGGSGGPYALFASVLERVSAAFQRILNFAQPALDLLVKTASSVGSLLAQGLATADFNAVFDVINTTLLGGILLLVSKFFRKGLSVNVAGGLFGSIRETFETLTGTLKVMQTQIKAEALLKIAIAVALLTASVVALSLIDSKKLTIALTGLGAIFGELLAAMTILGKVAGGGAVTKVPILAGAMILLGAAILILTASVKILSTLSWDELSRGLTGLAAILAIIVGFASSMNAAGGPLIRVGIAMIPLAAAILILVQAVQSLAGMSWADLAKGMTALAAALAIIAAAVYLIPASIIVVGPGLILLAVGLEVIVDVVKRMAAIKTEDLYKGLTAIGAALLIIAAAMNLMPVTLLITAAGLVVTAIALTILAKAVAAMGKMSWEEILKGLTTLAGAMLIIAGAMYLMTGALPGAAALLVVAAALTLFIPVIQILGSMNLGDIIKALGALAGIFVVLGLAGLLLAPIVLPLLGVAAALVLIGLGLALAGAGALGFAAAFSLFAIAGAAGIAVVGQLIKLIPLFLTAFAIGILAFATTIADNASGFVNAFTKLVGSLLDALTALLPKVLTLLGTLLDGLLNLVIKYVPKLFTVVGLLISQWLKVLTTYVPKIAQAGLDILLALLKKIKDNIPLVVTAVVGIATQFVRSIGQQVKPIADALFDMVIDAINGLANSIRANGGRLGAAVANLGTALVDGLISGIGAAWHTIVDYVKEKAASLVSDIAHSFGIPGGPAKEMVPIGAGIVHGIVAGLESAETDLRRSSQSIANTAIKGIGDTIRKTSNTFTADIDVNPVITPVLDLSTLTTQAGAIGGLLGAPSVTAGVSYANASDISSSQATLTADAASADSAVPTQKIEFNQTNISPKPLDPVTIYRQTKNQLSIAANV